MKSIFGTNWKTTASGLLCVLCALAAAKPALVEALPLAPWAKMWIAELAAYVAAISGVALAMTAKDKDVSGGRRVQNPKGKQVYVQKDESE